MSSVITFVKTIEVNLQGQSDALSLIKEDDWQNWFQIWLNHTLTKTFVPEATGYELSLRLTDDQEIQSFNDQYRQKDQPTDVLAFAALEVETPTLEGLDSLYLGDIVISLETAQQQATAQGHSLETEVIWLASHGFLHLLGWDHPDQKHLEEMLFHQEDLLNLIGISLLLR